MTHEKQCRVYYTMYHSVLCTILGNRKNLFCNLRQNLHKTESRNTNDKKCKLNYQLFKKNK